MKEWTNGIMGVLLGDALGNPVQFTSRKSIKKRGLVKGMEAGGVFQMPKGCWTDDGSMTLATLDSILTMGKVDPDDIMKRFVEWDRDGKYTPTGKAYDQGITCREAIGNFSRGKKWNKCGREGEHANGNGGLMRIMPVCLYEAYLQQTQDKPDPDAVSEVHHVTLLTHNHLRACTASGLYYFMVREILNSRDNDKTFKDLLQTGLDAGIKFYKNNNMDDEMPHFSRIRDLDAFSCLEDDKIKSSGYVIHSLEAALWSLITTNSFDEALLKAVNLGDDADTVGCIAGGLAGLYYGYDSVPREWKEDMVSREILEGICNKADQQFAL